MVSTKCKQPIKVLIKWGSPETVEDKKERKQK